MNKSDVIKSVANRLEKSQDSVEDVVNAFLDTVGLTLACGEEVKIARFGKFEVRERRPVTRRNPRTGAPVTVPAKRALLFKPSPNLKARLNGSGVSYVSTDETATTISEAEDMWDESSPQPVEGTVAWVGIDTEQAAITAQAEATVIKAAPSELRD